MVQFFSCSKSLIVTIKSDVTAIIAKRKTMNKVYEVNFGEKSSHVAHLRHNAELYTDTMRRFLKFTIGEK